MVFLVFTVILSNVNKESSDQRGDQMLQENHISRFSMAMKKSSSTEGKKDKAYFKYNPIALKTCFLLQQGMGRRVEGYIRLSSNGHNLKSKENICLLLYTCLYFYKSFFYNMFFDKIYGKSNILFSNLF